MSDSRGGPASDFTNFSTPRVSEIKRGRRRREAALDTAVAAAPYSTQIADATPEHSPSTMPKKVKKFIDKKNAVTYALMARPGDEDEMEPPPSSKDSMLSGVSARTTRSTKSDGAQVWMRKDNNHHARDVMAEAVDDGSVFNDAMTETMSQMSGMSQWSNVTWVMGPNGPVPRRERLSREKRRELRELGFDPNEGYDYTRHLRQVGEGGGTMFVPTRKDHVKGIRERDGEVAEHKLTAGGSGKKGTDSELVYLKEDVERDGDAARAINDERSDTAQARAASEEDERWTHERVKAVTREKVYVAKDTSAANAVVARAVRARPKGGASAKELDDMIDTMEAAELAADEELPNLDDEFGDGGLGDLQDDFILQAMLGDGEAVADAHDERHFPPVVLRYDETEVERQLEAIEEELEEEALEEEEEELAANGGFFGYGKRGPGSDAGTDRDEDFDEQDWDAADQALAQRRRDGPGATLRDLDEQFEALAMGYDSDEIGELDDDDPRIFGHAELDRFGHVMEEFRRDHVHRETYKTAADILEDGADVPDIDEEEGAEEGSDDGEYGRPLVGPAKAKEFRVTEEDVEDARGAMIAMRKRAGLPMPEHLAREMTLGDGTAGLGADDEVARRYELVEEGEGVGDDSIDAVKREIAYLNVEDKDDTWDVETVVSTFNNWENHPAEIDVGPALNKPKKKRGKPNVGAAEGGGDGAANVIRLSEVNGLPVDYVQSRRGKGRGGNGLTAANLAAIGEAAEGEWGSDEGDEEDEEFEGTDFGGEEWRSNIRRKGETAEEKKARKAAVKLGRREARAAKKGLKTTFKQEQAEMSKKRPTGDVRQGLSVRVID